MSTSDIGWASFVASAGILVALRLPRDRIRAREGQLLQSAANMLFCSLVRASPHELHQLRSWRRRVDVVKVLTLGWMMGSLTLCASSRWTPSMLISALCWTILGNESREQWQSES